MESMERKSIVKVGRQSAVAYTTRRNESIDRYFSDIAANAKVDVAYREKAAFELFKLGGRDAEKATREIVNAHLALVVSVAKVYQGNGLELSDLIQEGNIGLIKAIPLFKVESGNKFSSFAVHYIRKSIGEGIESGGRIVRLPHNVARVEPQSKSSMDAPLKGGEDENKVFGDTFAADYLKTDTNLSNEDGIKGLDLKLQAILTERERFVICKAFGINSREYADWEIGEMLSLTGERARQIKCEALDKIKSANIFGKRFANK